MCTPFQVVSFKKKKKEVVTFIHSLGGEAFYSTHVGVREQLGEVRTVLPPFGFST